MHISPDDRFSSRPSDPPDPAGLTVSPELLTVPDAARVAGVSVRTMRRWATRGQVRTVGRGHRRRVVAASLSEPAATVDTNGQNGHEERSHNGTVSATTDTETAKGHEADRLADLVRNLADRLAEQTAMTALWMERARVLSDQLALSAPQQPPEAPGAPHSAEPTPGEPPSARWHVWAPWLLVVLAIVVAVGMVAVPR